MDNRLAILAAVALSAACGCAKNGAGSGNDGGGAPQGDTDAAVAGGAESDGGVPSSDGGDGSDAGVPWTPPDVAKLVNPLIGTDGADTFPGADTPFGMVQWSPENTTGDQTHTPYPGGYSYS